MQFIYAFNEEDKNLLINGGYEFIQTTKMGCKDVYVFEHKEDFTKFSSSTNLNVLVSDIFFV